MPSTPVLWTRAYSLLCAAVFLVSGQQSMVLVVLPLYVTHLGGSALVAGLVLFAFSLPSFSSRPLIGYWADTWSLVGVFSAGGLILGLTTAFYLFPLLITIVLVSIVRGVGWGGSMTGSYAMLARLSPESRRGEASGYFSSVFSATNILFPALGLWLASVAWGGYRSVFLVAAVLALGSGLLSHLWLRPALPQLPTERRAGAGISGLALERSVLLPTLLSFALSVAQPAVIAFLPLYARHQGIPNIAAYFVLSGIASLAIRPILGRVGDRIGHGYSVVAGFLAQISGVLLIAGVGSLPAILAGGVLNALGNAICGAAVLGLAIELASPKRRGAAMGTFTVSFQLGNGVGSVLAGSLLSIFGFSGMYAGTVALLVSGLVLALGNWPRLGVRLQTTPQGTSVAD